MLSSFFHSHNSFTRSVFSHIICFHSASSFFNHNQFNTIFTMFEDKQSTLFFAVIFDSHFSRKRSKKYFDLRPTVCTSCHFLVNGMTSWRFHKNILVMINRYAASKRQLRIFLFVSKFTMLGDSGLFLFRCTLNIVIATLMNVTNLFDKVWISGMGESAKFCCVNLGKICWFFSIGYEFW